MWEKTMCIKAIQKNMLGNASWGFREMELEEQLALTEHLGLSFHELGIANGRTDVPLDASEDLLEAVKRRFEEHEIRLWCAATGNDFTLPDKRDTEENVRKVCGAVKVAGKLGIPYLRVFAGFSHAEEVTGERWDRMVDCLTRAARFGEEEKVTLCVEIHGGVESFADGVFHYHSVTTRLDALRRLLTEVPDTIRLVYDPANLFAAGVGRPEEFYERIKERVAYIHLKDFKRLPDGRLRPEACGRGDMSWAGILSGLADFDGPVLFEYENPQRVEAGSRECLEFLQTAVYK